MCRQSFVYDILKLNGEKYTYLEMKGTNLDVILAENRDYHLIRPTIPSYSFTSNGRIMTSHLDLNLVMSSSMRWNEPFFITNEQKIQELFNITRYVDTSYSVSMQRLNAIKCCDSANVRQYLYLFQDVLGLEYAIKEEKFPPLSFEFLYAHDMISDINIKEKIRFLLVENQRRPDIDTKIKDEKFTRSKDYVFTTRDSYLESNLEERLQKCVKWLEKFNCYQEYFIADIASNHDGSLERAFRLIELAKESGADAAKFQNFKANLIVSKHGFEHLGGKLSHQKKWDKSVYSVYQDASVPDDWSPRLKEKCDSVGLEYMTSPYDFSSVDLADQYAHAFKIGSGDITWTEIIQYIAQKGKPVLLATGASELEDVDRAVHIIESHTSDIVLMQCNTNYTGSENNFNSINLNVLKTYQKRYPHVILGLSDHTHGHTTVLGAIALGAHVIEKHFTDDNNRRGPDHAFSMTPSAWKCMVEESMHLFKALGTGEKHIEENEQETAIVQRRALYFTRALKKGTVLTDEMLFPVRPCQRGCYPPYEKAQLIGKTLKRDVEADTPVRQGDVEI